MSDLIFLPVAEEGIFSICFEQLFRISIACDFVRWPMPGWTQCLYFKLAVLSDMFSAATVR